MLFVMPAHAILSLTLGLILNVTSASSASTYYRNISTVVLLFRDFARLKSNLLGSNNYSVEHYERELPEQCEHFRMIANLMLDSSNEIEFRFKVSISTTFYEQLLRVQIPKAQKRQSTQAAFCGFGIWARKSCS